MTPSPWPRRITIAAVMVLAIIAAAVSYAHMFELALRHGEPKWRAALFPLSVDGTVVAASMTLLSDARQGRRGGFLPWSLLILGSIASLAANIAVADPTAWSRIIHAWPSFALIGSYELLMRQFRATVSCTRNEHAVRTQTYEDIPAEEHGGGPALEDETAGVADVQPALRVVEACSGRSTSEVGGPVDTETPPPRIQCEAWSWALRYRDEHGMLPTGKQIADAHDRRERWGRSVKQRGEKGRLDQAVA